MLVLEHDLLLVRVVTWNPLHLGERRYLQLVAGVTVEELSLLLDHLLDGLTDIVIELLHQSLLLLVFFHFLMDETVSAVDDLLVKLELSLFLV